MKFVYSPLPSRVIFEPGALDRVREEAILIGRRALVLSTPEQRPAAELVRDQLDGIAVGVFDGAAMHVPTSTVAEALSQARSVSADMTVAIGGGSTIGLAKALSLRAKLPSLAIPTTYAGSEVTALWGLTEQGVKKTGRDISVLPRTVLYDPVLTLSLPVTLSVTSGLNAIAHCLEGLYARDGNPIVSLMAEEGIRALSHNLPKIKRQPDDLEARTQALYGSWLAGAVLGATSVALHHKLCHVLGGAYDMPHSETHAAVLPHAIAYNAGHAPDAMRRAAAALGASEVPRALYELAASLGAEMSLKALGLPSDGIDRVVELAAQAPYPNPRPITAEGIKQIMIRAFEGLPPERAS